MKSIASLLRSLNSRTPIARIGFAAAILTPVFCLSVNALESTQDKTAPETKPAPPGSGTRALPELKVDNAPLAAGTPTYAPIVEKVSPSVVTIDTSQRIVRGGDIPGHGGRNPFLDDPTLRRFFGIPEDSVPQTPRAPQPRREPNGSEGRKREQSAPLGLGSGVVVSADGYILTNNHVIEGADKIEVGIGNSPRKYVAQKIGGDPRTDIAVLKIEAKGLTPITFADSEHLRPGDIVIAVGNPFGLTRSATMGVVSAVGRRDRQVSQVADLGDFIQTDAAINMGNSGGALVDYQGRLVGINTAIFSRSGGNQGIGFSVPSNTARSVMESLIKHGRVLRGFLGIGLQDLTESLEKKLNVDAGVGSLIIEVQPNSPAEKSGLRTYDVVTAVNGKKVEGTQELRLRIAGMLPGSKVTLQVVRDRKPLDLAVQLGEKPEKESIAKVEPQEEDPDVLDGVTVADLDEAARRKFNIPEQINGALVSAVEGDSIAASEGIRPGDVIQEVERRPVRNAEDAVKMSEELKKEKQVIVRVYGRGGSRVVTLESKP
ncbi:MAG: hypothetical protein RLZZ244_644 [Verrucomicrobiota bacterium]|jgi:serine protease Do